MTVGVIVGRFQVPFLHEGHRKLIYTSSECYDRVLVLVGVSPVDGRCANNPLSYYQRETILCDWLNETGIQNVSVMPLLDQRNDEDWSKQLDTLIEALYPTADVKLVHGRDSGFVKYYTGRFPLVDVGQNCDTSGRQIRDGIAESTNEEFMAGQAYALNYQYPHAYPCVDAAILRFMRTLTADPMSWHVLVIKRADTGIWCFPGGFVDPTDLCLEHAVRREMAEELGLGFADHGRYISSRLQKDWRYRGSRDKIISSFFAITYFSGPVRINPTEVSDYKWVTVENCGTVVADTHKAFAQDLFAWCRTNLPVPQQEAL